MHVNLSKPLQQRYGIVLIVLMLMPIAKHGYASCGGPSSSAWVTMNSQTTTSGGGCGIVGFLGSHKFLQEDDVTCYTGTYSDSFGDSSSEYYVMRTTTTWDPNTCSITISLYGIASLSGYNSPTYGGNGSFSSSDSIIYDGNNCYWSDLDLEWQAVDQEVSTGVSHGLFSGPCTSEWSSTTANTEKQYAMEDPCTQGDQDGSWTEYLTENDSETLSRQIPDPVCQVVYSLELYNSVKNAKYDISWTETVRDSSSNVTGSTTCTATIMGTGDPVNPVIKVVATGDCDITCFNPVILSVTPPSEPGDGSP